MAQVALKSKARTEEKLKDVSKDMSLCTPASAEPVGMANEIVDEEERLWEVAIANSMDAFREMAENARENRRAGRTKKITL